MVKLGIIGTGGMAEYQAKRFSENDTCQLWACKDQHAEHARQFAERFHIPYNEPWKLGQKNVKIRW